MLDGTLPAPVAGTRVHGRIELRAGGSAANAAARGGASRGACRSHRPGRRRRRRQAGGRHACRGRRRGVVGVRRGCADRLRRRRGWYVDRRRSRSERPARAGRSARRPSMRGPSSSPVTRSCSEARNLPREPRSSARGRAGWPWMSARPASSRRSASSDSWRRRRLSACCWRTPRRHAPSPDSTPKRLRSRSRGTTRSSASSSAAPGRWLRGAKTSYTRRRSRSSGTTRSVQATRSPAGSSLPSRVERSCPGRSELGATRRRPSC